MIRPAPKSHDMYKIVRRAIEERAVEELAASLKEYGEKRGAASQLVLALTCQKVVDDELGPNSVPSLGETITVQQSHKIGKYGDKTYPLSERQIDVIVRGVTSVDLTVG